MILDEFVTALPDGGKIRPSKTFGRKWVGRCPACSSKSPHLAVWEGRDGWIKLKCAAGHNEDEILLACGRTQQDRLASPREKLGAKRPERVHVYTNADGLPRFQKCIRPREGGGKMAFVQSFTEKGLVNGKESLNGEGKLLYRLGDVLMAQKTGATVYVNEGEDACDIMAGHGLIATCQPDGAGSGKWLPEHSSLLKGLDVVIVADRDEVGEDYAREVAGALKGIAKSVRVVQSKTTNPKDDAYDHFVAGGTVEDFVPRPDLKGPKPLSLTRFDPKEEIDVEVEFLWEPYLPRGRCILLDADGGTGKTTFAVVIAACLTQGIVPYTTERQKPMKGLYIHKGEDSSEEIAWVFRRNGGDLSRFVLLDDPGFDFSPRNLQSLEATIEAEEIDLVIVDALLYFVRGVIEDEYRTTSVMVVMEALNAIARRTRAAFWNIRHTKKGRVGVEASNLGIGSVQFRNSHRGQIVMRWHPEKRGVVVLTDEKGSLLVPKGEPLAFRRTYDAQVELIHLDEGDPFAADGGDGEERAANAKDWLQAILSQGDLSREDVMKRGRSAGLSEKSIKRAATSLGITDRGSRQSVWTLRTRGVTPQGQYELTGGQGGDPFEVPG